ncbi:MAG TPA: CBS domain-containing protein [Bryobacteraceae bacterium]|nr:CBS domain-containing protein [Bryobacteraceae bacterium]
MPIGDVCVRDVVVATKDATIQQAAMLMRRHHVGDLVVVEERADGRKIPVGIVTDRDIVVSVVAPTLNAAVYTVGDLAIRELVTLKEDQGVFEAIQQMRVSGVRRMPVVDGAGGLVGIISVDDLVQLLSEEMSELAKLISRERVLEIENKR